MKTPASSKKRIPDGSPDCSPEDKPTLKRREDSKKNAVVEKVWNNPYRYLDRILMEPSVLKSKQDQLRKQVEDDEEEARNTKRIIESLKEQIKEHEASVNELEKINCVPQSTASKR